jgi:predicted nucleotidyltransferase
MIAGWYIGPFAADSRPNLDDADKMLEWIRKNKAPPPMEFEKLANEILDDDSVKNRVFDLLSRKRNNEELGEGPSIPTLNKYIEETISFYETYASSIEKNVVDIEQLNNLFRKTISLGE